MRDGGETATLRALRRRSASARQLARALALAAVVGVLGGIAAAIFRSAVDEVPRLFPVAANTILDVARKLPRLVRVLVPTLGALIGALLTRFVARGDTPYGVADLMEVVSLRRRQVKLLPTLGRISASFAFIASGGSVGREGPIIQLGATLSSLLGRFARGDARAQSILLGCGAAAGMAAAYNAPLAGACFVMEVILGNFAMDVFASVALAALTATMTMRAILGDKPIYDVPTTIVCDTTTMLVAALPLGLLCGGLAVAFQRLLQRTTRFFDQLEAPALVKPVLGGLAVGLIGIGLPEVWGNGYQAASELLESKMPLSIIVLLFVMKPVATAATVGSGGKGGVFTPSLLLGATGGALFGTALHLVAPSLDAPRSGLAVCGMAGVLAGITHAPIMATLLLFEMTHHPGLILPVAASALAGAVAHKVLARDSLYTERLRARGVPVDAGIEELTLHQTRVRDLMRRDAPTVHEKTPLDEIVQRFSEGRIDVLYVLDDLGALRGIINLHDVKDFFNRHEEASPAIIAVDVMRKAPTLDARRSIAEVIEAFDDPELEELPVGEGDEETKVLLGRVTRRDLIACLNLEVLGRQSLRAKFVVEGPPEPRYLELPRGFELARVSVPPSLVGKELGQSGVRELGLIVLAVVESDPEIGEQRAAPDPKLVLKDGQSLVLMGRHDEIEALRAPRSAS